MKLTDNAFAVLGASPRDDRRRLAEKADEMTLLGEGDVEAALNQLMQMNRRIPAELGWFPGATDAAVDAFLAYARDVAGGKAAAVPPLDGLGTPLAQANALAALFEIWPTDVPELYAGLCRAMDAILGKITVAETLQAVNADREAGKWETIPDEFSITGPLDDRLRELCGPLSQAMAQMPTSDAAAMLDRLFVSGNGGIDLEGSVAQAVANAYTMHIHDQTENMKTKLLALMEGMGKQNVVIPREIENLQSQVDAWNDLSRPLRKQPGAMRADAKAIAHAFRNVVVNYVNKAPTQKLEKKFSFPVFNGTRTVTIEYNSKTYAVSEAIKYNNWMRERFSEQVELKEQLREDDAQLRQIIDNEQTMLRNAEMEARAKSQFASSPKRF